MSFSKGQQAEYRRLEKAAWQRHARRLSLDPKDKLAYDEFYRSELAKATGHRSTKDCDKGRNYDAACAHFEALADDGIRHQLNLIQGDLRRIRYAAAKINPAWPRQFRSDADLEVYVRGIVRQAFGRDVDLHLLSDAQISVITNAVRIDANRSRRN